MKELFSFLFHWYELLFIFIFFILLLCPATFKFLKKIWRWLLGLFVINSPFLLYKILFNPWHATQAGLQNSDFLIFWGSFIGALIGGVATFIAVYWTLRHNEKHYKEQDEIKKLDTLPLLDIDFVNEQFEVFQKNRNSLVAPIIYFTDEYYDSQIAEVNLLVNRYQYINYKDNKFIYYCNLDPASSNEQQRNNTCKKIKYINLLKIKNIGLGPSTKIKLNISTIGNPYKNIRIILGLGKEQSSYLFIAFNASDNQEYNLKFIYQDIYEHWFSQILKYKAIVENENPVYFAQLDFLKTVTPEEKAKFKQYVIDNGDE